MNFTKYIEYISNLKRTVDIAKTEILQRSVRNPMIAPIFRTFLSVPKPHKWIFVVGCYNSGTTVLLKLLAQHPQISTLDEGSFCTSELIMPEKLGWTRMWHKVEDAVRLDADDMNINVAAVKKDWSLFFDRTKPIFLEKSIVNSARMPWLQTNFDNAQFIYIVRNGYAVAEGIRRKVINRRWPIPKEYGQTYPIELCAQQWVRNSQIIEQDLKLTRLHRQVTYEDLCEKPEHVIESLWKFIGLDIPSGWYDESRPWRIHSDQSKIKNMNQQSIDRLSIADVDAITDIAGPILDLYQYPRL